MERVMKESAFEILLMSDPGGILQHRLDIFTPLGYHPEPDVFKAITRVVSDVIAARTMLEKKKVIRF